MKSHSFKWVRRILLSITFAALSTISFEVSADEMAAEVVPPSNYHLFKAIRTNNVAEVERQLAAGANHSLTEPDRFSVVHAAAMQGNIQIMQLLLDHGADIDAQTEFGETTPLMLALNNGNRDMAILLIEKGADISRPNRFSHTPLLLAVKMSDISLILLLLEHGAKADTTGHFLGQYECDQGWIRDEGHGYFSAARDARCHVNPSYIRDSGNALTLAANAGNLEIVRLLLRHGAKAYHGEPVPPIVSAVARGRLEIVKELLAHGENADALFYDGLTPLHLAAAHGNVPMAELLVAHCASIDSSRKEPYLSPMFLQSFTIDGVKVPISLGTTPLHLAIVNGQLEMVRWLLAHGARLEGRIKGEHGAKYSVLDLAIGPQVVAYYQSLTSVNTHWSPNHDTPPAISSSTRREIAKILLASGATVGREKRFGGVTTLHMAAKLGDPELIGLLLDHGAEINARDMAGMSPLQYADKAGNSAAAEMLRQRGAM